jgi:hypothetical protein
VQADRVRLYELGEYDEETLTLKLSEIRAEQGCLREQATSLHGRDEAERCRVELRSNGSARITAPSGSPPWNVRLADGTEVHLAGQLEDLGWRSRARRGRAVGRVKVTAVPKEG